MAPPIALPGFRVHHLGVAVTDLEAAIPVYQQSMGLRVVSGPFDDPIQKVRVCFLGNGEANEATIELIAPLQEDAPIHQYLKKGLGAYHICYSVGQLDRAIEHLRSYKCLLISGPVPAVAFNMRRIAWLLMPTRHLIELVEHE